MEAEDRRARGDIAQFHHRRAGQQLEPDLYGGKC
jgi:hypothetical protein